MSVLDKNNFDKSDLITWLQATDESADLLRRKALDIKDKYVGRKVYFRGLIEYSNRCSKNCLYCGIRSCNPGFHRYTLTKEEVLSAARYAFDHRFASLVIQAGENQGPRFIDTIESLLNEINQQTSGSLHITLSLGEQTEETYQRWKAAGAHRYLLRIEASDPELYKKLHPDDGHHTWESRIRSLQLLRKTGYQVGTGVMIGVPFQTLENLADDLLFFREFDIDMVGMGPYIEHPDTPLYSHRDQIPSPKERMELTLNMVALLRIMMTDINIAATTAMQTLDPRGREKALLAGANVMMPNLTPLKYKEGYLLYENKPGIEDDADESLESMEQNIQDAGETIGYGEWGDSLRYGKR